MVDVTELASTTGGATLAGGLAGFAAKKLLKLLALLVGLQFAFLAYLEHLELIHVNWDGLSEGTETFFEMVTTMSVPDGVGASEMATTGGAFGGFGLGFLVGFRRG